MLELDGVCFGWRMGEREKGESYGEGELDNRGVGKLTWVYPLMCRWWHEFVTWRKLAQLGYKSKCCKLVGERQVTRFHILLFHVIIYCELLPYVNQSQVSVSALYYLPLAERALPFHSSNIVSARETRHG